ncbi:hypothetical protein H4R34_003411 [Dimargaris verticillata]|uniref:U6 snRNA-associated Sm-like protein LSm1 n=1 Tax=Dimargaris verticillata TaxID=2761393 RepID=A0A9W8ED65_9FUNG|nr:hypothetical protein H4R34_003411 [Dimargaris verticillata]
MSSFLPNHLFTTSGSLVDLLDKRLLVILRDGRKILGFLRSYDQYERIYVKDVYGDIQRGVFVIRGENVVLLGEIDNIKDDEQPLQQLPYDQVLRMQQEEAEARQQKEKVKNQLLHNQGFSVDFLETDLY